MKPSALSIYINRHSDQLAPETKQILMSLPDGVIELARTALFADLEMPKLDAPPDNKEDMSEYQAYQRAWLRHNVPALNPLSDEELDVVLTAAFKMECDDMAAEEYFAENHQYMSEDDHRAFQEGRFKDITFGRISRSE